MKNNNESNFFNPPSEYRTTPFLVWNDKMEIKQIKSQLQELKTHGFGGAFIHPRPGLITEYLSDEWFDCWEYAVQLAEELDLKLYIYDENSYPSGFAGGHVSSQLPDCLETGVAVHKVSANDLGTFFYSKHPNQSKIKILKVYAFQHHSLDGKLHVIRDVTLMDLDIKKECGDDFLVLEIVEGETTPWHGDFAYVDLLRPEVAREFLSSTYEEYKNRFSVFFGNIIPAVFTDEPAVSSGNQNENVLPFSFWFASEFESRNGYDIKEYLLCLFFDMDGSLFEQDSRKIRYDYYCTLRELFVKNFMQPISAWCEENQLAWTGHYLEHSWPYPWFKGFVSPAVMSMYEYMHWPSIDMLWTDLLKNGPEPLFITIREVASVANQMNRERVLCETNGSGGWDSTFGDYKRIGDWLMVHGVNFINQHLTHSTITGARKRDHPQSFDWRQPWWKEYKTLADYYGRLSYALSQGETVNRILVLNPTTAGFMKTPDAENDSLWSRQNEPKDPLVYSFFQLVQALSDNQWDYDLGDEFILERHGRVDEARMTVHSRQYEVVIIPEYMSHMKESTLNLLLKFLENGGHVITLGETPERIEGSISQKGKLISQYSNCIKASEVNGVDPLLKKNLKPYVTIKNGDQFPSGLTHLRRDLGDGSAFYFIVNSSQQNIDSMLEVEGGHLELWDALDGERKSQYYYTANENLLRTDVKLSPNDSKLFRVYQQKRLSDNSNSKTAFTRTTPLETDVLEITPEEDNMLSIDYCDLDIGGKKYEGIHTMHAGQLVFHHHGFKANPWDRTIQFKRRILDREPFPKDSGFNVTYAFHVKDGCVPDRLKLVVEHGKYYHLEVNGQVVHWSNDSHWLDHHMGTADIDPYVQKGPNRIMLKVQPFYAILEVEAVYLEGNFGLEQIDSQWVLGKKPILSLGSWRKQGYDFYSQAMQYRHHVTVHKPFHGRYTVCLPKWSGTVASLFVNGKYVGIFGLPGGKQIDITDHLVDGSNEVMVRICGSLKNLLGPHHDTDKPRRHGFPTFWEKAPKSGQPSPDQYDFIDYGLMEDFVIEKNSE